ncbi:glycosyl transferases group 1-domain-containing protein [Suillus spraguei]|nr:glycosyl transferases group 1-domain-containing protein [Suillus spraguei]
MTYHVESFAKLGFDTYLIGYKGSKLIISLTSLSNIKLSYLSESPPLFVLAAPIKIMHQIAAILYTLVFIMIQNPPSIPTLPLAWLVGVIMGNKVIIDWHNLRYSVLALRFGKNTFAGQYCKTIIFGSSTYTHLFVTNVMRNHLEQEWGLIFAVLHDRPPSHFRNLRKDRPALLVSSTSWTPDEDFDILLEALKLYESRAREEEQVLPRIWMVITGKGPLKKRYMEEVELLQENWRYVRCTTLWLEAEGYPLLLGSADLSISLYSSSSALDLPMKFVDMFGCGLPVCALDFACRIHDLPELVKDGINGLVFRNARQLAEHLETLLTYFPSSPALDSLQTTLQRALQVPLNVEHRIHHHKHQERDDWEWVSLSAVL